MDWAGDHPWTVAGLGLGIVGAGLLVGYSSHRHHFHGRRGARLGRGRAAHLSGERRQVVSEYLVACLLEQSLIVSIALFSRVGRRSPYLGSPIDS